VKSFHAEELLRLPVRVRGIEVGRAVDVLLDLAAGRVLGVEVLCRDHSHRFLALSAAEIGDDALATGSALTLLAEDQLDFYRKRATSLRALRGLPVIRRGRNLGALADVLLTRDGQITDAEVVKDSRRSRYRWEEALRISASAA
jgi:sporulation protein YlmC with PRC-barrel domain